MPYELLPETPKEQTPILESVGRIGAQAGKGALSALPGFAGNLMKGVNEIIARPISKAITGGSLPYEKTTLGKVLPTTKQHAKTLEENIDFLKPKNRVEQFASDITSDATELFLPGRLLNMGRYAFSPLRSLGVSLASNTGGLGTELFTGSKEKGENVKNGMQMALSLINPTNARNVAQGLYQTADRLLPQTAMQNAVPLAQRFTTLENQILRGRPRDVVAPSERFVLDQIDNFRHLIQNNQVNMQQLVAQKRSFNEELGRNLFNIPNRAERARARELAQNISRATRNTMEEYGRTNPTWWQNQSGADRAFGAIQQSNYISRALQGFMRGRPEALSHMLGIGIPGGMALFSPVGGALSAAGYGVAKIMTQISRSPELRRHYGRVIRAAIQGNPKIINKELDGLQEEVQKKEKGAYKFIQE